jgi:hypothetical protein
MLVGARSEPMRIRAETTSSIVLLRPPVPVAIDANTARASHDRVSALSRCRCATTRCPSRSRNVRLRFSSLVLCRLCVWSDCWVLKRGFVGAHGTDRTSKWPVPMCLVSVGQREPFNEPGKKETSTRSCLLFHISILFHRSCFSISVRRGKGVYRSSATANSNGSPESSSVWNL